MILESFTETSILMLFFRNTRQAYYCFKQYLVNGLSESYIYAWIKRIKYKAQIYYSYSLWSSMLKRYKNWGYVSLEEGMIADWMALAYSETQRNVFHYFKSSVVMDLLSSMKKEYYSLPVKAISVVMIVATMTNIIFAVLLQKEISLSGWIVRAVILFMGIAGISKKTQWEELRKTSFILNKYNEKNKNSTYYYAP